MVELKVLKPAAKLSPLEWKRGALLFAAFFLCILAILFTRPIRSALVLEYHSPDVLPTLWLYTGGVMFAWIFIYNRLLRRFKPEGVFVGSAAVFGLILFGIERGLHVNPSVSSELLYVWNDVASIAIVEQIWSLLDDYFNEEQAKRSFGTIGAGGILGGLMGSWLSTQCVGRFSSAEMVQISVGMMGVMFLPCVFLAYGLKAPREEGEFDRKRVQFRRGFQLIRDSRFLQLLALSVLLIQIASNVVDLQFNSYVHQNYSGTEDRTRYLGHFLMWMNAFSAFLMLGLPVWILRRFGVRAGLLILPVMNGGAALASLFGIDRAYPASKFVDKSFNYSIQRASKEILYIPIRAEDRFQLKPIFDVFFYRMSETVAALLVIPFLKLFSWHYLGALTTVICVFQVFVIFQIFKALKLHELEKSKTSVAAELI